LGGCDALNDTQLICLDCCFAGRWYFVVAWTHALEHPILLGGGKRQAKRSAHILERNGMSFVLVKLEALRRHFMELITGLPI
jgi:hypothetical protein